MYSAKDISDLALVHFNLSVNTKQLVGFEDLNFYLRMPSGKDFIMKIAHSGAVIGELEMQNALLKHLESKNLNVDLPRVLPNTSGELITLVRDDEGHERGMRVLTWVEGRLWASVNPRTHRLLYKLGRAVGEINAALSDFDHPLVSRPHEWDLSASLWISKNFRYIKNLKHREIAEYFYGMYNNEVLPKLEGLRRQTCYNDANDYNILVDQNMEDPQINGAIDFGDCLYTHTVNELAICIAYAVNEQRDPLAAAAEVVRGFNDFVPLTERELEVLFALVAMRVLVSVSSAAANKVHQPDNEYLQINARPGWDLLEKWHKIAPAFGYYTFRNACGFEACPKRTIFDGWNKDNPLRMETLLGEDFNKKKLAHLDLSVGSTDLGNNAEFNSIEKFKNTIARMLTERNAEIGIGGYGETRPFYTTDAYQVIGNSGPQWRTVHLGTDVWTHSGTPVFAPWPGKLHSFNNNEGERNYGPTIILEHTYGKGLVFYTLYGHLSIESLAGLEKGQTFDKGEQIATIGPAPENGNWPPHLHFQIILDLLGWDGDFPGVAYPDEKGIWLSVCPEGVNLEKYPLRQNLNLNPSSQVEEPQVHGNTESLIGLRNKFLPQSLSLSFAEPLHIVRGYMQYLYDDTGRRYLDTNNNVPHVGHQHPDVVKAAQRQIAVLNTNTRYLHSTIIRYAEALLDTFPPELCVCFFVNSGSEANELALRMAKTYSGQKDMIVVEHGYHGNTGACVDISSYKFDGKGGKGAPPHTHVVPAPDTYRGLYRSDEKKAGEKYASHVHQAIELLKSEGRGLAGFICESILSCGGQIVLPEGYLRSAYQYVREAGGVCIADEVQVGFGRVGDAFWGFELQGVVPDIVTLGKPMGNGHPLGAVVTTRAVADAFNNGMEYFNTYGGNPVSCAIGLEVLQVIQRENLQQNAKATGEFLKSGLERLKSTHSLISDVRGHGLFLGFELVKSRETQEPATRQAAYLKNRMKELGILTSTDGPFENVIKIKPPLCFDKSHAHFFLDTLGMVLREDFLSL